MNRIIGQFGGLQPGALVVAVGALHGNEPAGVRALEEVFALLNRMAAQRPLDFKGKLIGLIGHRQAFASGQRYIRRDLNRLWLTGTVERILADHPADLRDEELEIRELYAVIDEVVRHEKPETLILLDLHTTSATGGIFCIPTDEADSLALARELHTPVILNLFEGLSGTLLGFAAAGHFSPDRAPQRTLGVAFEAGQHEDPLSVSRSVAALLHCLRASGCVAAAALPDHYDVVLRAYSSGLPEVTRLLYVHHVQPGDHFRMHPGYVNFQEIRAGEWLADDAAGPIRALSDGLILMPLYQPQGTDGFFVVTTE